MRHQGIALHVVWRHFLVVLLYLACVTPASAQIVSVRGPERVSVEQEVALYVYGRGQIGADGWIVEIPAAWRLREASVVDRQRISTLPSTLESLGGQGKRYRVTTLARVRSSFDLVLVVQPGRRTGLAEVKVWPFVTETTAGRERTRLLSEVPFVHPMQVGPPGDGGANRALYLARGDRPLPVRANRAQALYEPGAFTVELWLKTSRRDVVALSTWTGDERDAYPLELLIDLRGRLTWYWGQPGWHQSLTTAEPVADGTWHHVALMRDPDRSVYRLYVDGVARDSLHATANHRAGVAGPLVVGGRPLPSTNADRMVPPNGFIGWVDELRIWKTARTGSEIRRTMYVPLRSSGTDRWVMGFDSESALRADGSGVAGVRPTDLALLMPISDLRVRPESGWVELEWTVDSGHGQTFFVERSGDGVTFDPIGTVQQVADTGTPGRRAYQFTDAGPNGGGAVLTYRIRQVFESGAEQVSGAVKVGLGPAEPQSVRLVGNSPNPFTTRTQISVDVRMRQYVRLSVWGLSGHPVAFLVDRELDAGLHSFLFEALDLPSGMYFAVIDSESGQQTIKMTLMN